MYQGILNLSASRKRKDVLSKRKMLLVGLVFLILGNTLIDSRSSHDKHNVHKSIKHLRRFLYPEEMGSQDDIRNPTTSRSRRGTLVYRKPVPWPGKTLPYEISSSFQWDQRELILDAMKEVQENTCVKFRPKSYDDKNYIYFTNTGNSCGSGVGFWNEGRHYIWLGEGCTNVIGTAIHEILHAVGLWHEQNRPDRDEYVIINYENILPNHEPNFDKLPPEAVDTRIGYDYNSVMHYSALAFSKNLKPTIVPKINGVQIGQRFGMSTKDAQKVNLMYGCA